jgi:small-conductance mechanosensitive channel
MNLLQTKTALKQKKVNQNIIQNQRTILLICFIIVFVSFSFIHSPVIAQSGTGSTPTPSSDSGPSEVPDEIDIQPTARDYEISARLKRILVATGWFINPEVTVNEGVVFLSGQAKTGDYRKWAGDLARNTQDVVAVVNRMELTQPSLWDLKPAFDELRSLWNNFIRSLPLLGFSLLVLLLTIFFTRLASRLVRRTMHKRLPNTLLLNVAGYTAGVITFLVGLYILLQIAGLTNVAATVIGGTGLLGLVLGIAFRDITENFLASIFLSVQNPFRSGDLVEISGIRGFVEALNTRVTVLMTLDGNNVQIPNATVYKSNIYNFTSNPNRRADFIIGIGYEDSITNAQEVALKVLENHPAVLNDPEPMALVDSLGAATVNLRIYYWINGKEYSWFKVKSAVIRLIKLAFEDAGISMPDEARELIFPHGIPVEIIGQTETGQTSPKSTMPTKAKTAPESASDSTKAEAGLSSEATELKQQSKNAWKPGDGENLLQEDAES